MASGRQAWQAYEAAAVAILRQFGADLGLSDLEADQMVAGQQSGTKWKIDAKGVSDRGGGAVVIEIRRRLSKGPTQEEVAAVAFRIQDIGASGGIVVSPLPLQSGAKLVAASNNILHVQLSADSSPAEFIARFLDKLCIRLKPDAISASLAFVGATLEVVKPDGVGKKPEVK